MPGATVETGSWCAEVAGPAAMAVVDVIAFRPRGPEEELDRRAFAPDLACRGVAGSFHLRPRPGVPAGTSRHALINTR